MTSQTGPVPVQGRSLTLRTLGAAGLYAADGGELLLGPGKPLALLVFLALTPGRRTSREFLIDLLWADLEPERARSRPPTSALPSPAAPRGGCPRPARKNSPWRSRWTPIGIEFLASVEVGATGSGHRSAMTGHFLPAFGVPGGAAFEHWADLERERLQTAFLRSADLLVRRQLNQSRFKEAQRLARRVRDQVSRRRGGLAARAGGHHGGARLRCCRRRGRGARALGGNPRESASNRRRGRRSHGRACLRTRRWAGERRPRGRAYWPGARVLRDHRGLGGRRAAPARHLHLTAPAGLGKSRLLRDAVARLRAAGAAGHRDAGHPGRP